MKTARLASLSHHIVCGAGILLACMLAAPPASADDQESAAYQRLVPREPDSDLAATVIAPMCKDITTNAQLAKDLGTCSSWQGAFSFCSKPLDMAIPRPETSVLRTLVSDRCPVATKEALVSGQVSVKAATGLFDLGWQDALVRGLAAFLVERAKAEALAAAADRFRTGICEDAAGKKMFPLVCALLQASDPYSVPLSWGEVKAAAEKDLFDLPLHVLDLTLPRNSPTLKDTPLLLYTAIDLTEQVLAQHGNLLKLLVGLQTSYKGAAGKCGEQPTACALLVAGITSEVVIPGYKPGSIPPDPFVAVAARVITDRAIALGLIKPDGATLVFLQSFQNLVTEALKRVDAMSLQGSALGTNPRPADIVAFDNSVSGFVDSLISAAGPLVVASQPSLREVENLLATWNRFLSLSLNKDYLTAALQLFIILDTIGGDDMPPWLQRYLPPLAELAQADTPDKVKDVLQAIAAPVGSYRAKRGTGNRKLTVNGYLGGQFGLEWLGGGDIPKARSFQGGVFAPVGLESSWGFGKSSSLGIFLSVVDLGALVSFRTSSDTTPQGSGTQTTTVEKAPQIGLSQVFSPGIYGLWGIPCTPLVFGLGGALTPELRQVTLLSTGTTEKAAAFRVGAFLAIDITILPL